MCRASPSIIVVVHPIIIAVRVPPIIYLYVFSLSFCGVSNILFLLWLMGSVKLGIVLIEN